VEPIRAFRAVSAGLQVCLSELYHLDMQPLELTAVMDLLLRDGRSLAQAWIAGQRPFDAAACDPCPERKILRRLQGGADQDCQRPGSLRSPVGPDGASIAVEAGATSSGVT